MDGGWYISVNLVLFIRLSSIRRKLALQISIDEWLTIVDKNYGGNQMIIIYLYFQI